MIKLKISALTLTLIILITFSCKSFKKDHSLTTKEYEAMGMPDHTKLWSSQAYEKALIVLSKIKLKDPLSFPRKNSNKSGEVFSRFVNKDNLSFVNDSTISLVNRAYEILAFAGVQNKLTRSYTNESKPEQYYDEELIDSYIYGLYLHDKMLELAVNIYISEDRSVMNMKSGIRAVLNGYTQTAFLIMGEQVKSSVYKVQDLENLSLEVSRSLIRNMKFIESSYGEKLIPQLQMVIEKSSSDYIKKNYRDVLQVLNDKK